MRCTFCNRDINNKGGFVKHLNACKLNPERISYSYASGFNKYNAKVKSGEIKKNDNQWQRAKKLGYVVQLSDETRYKLGKGNRGRIKTNVEIEKLSMARSKFLEEVGNGGFKNIKWYKIKNILNVEYIVRGTWEFRIAELLNNNNILWIRKMYLSYTNSKGINKTYTPDFYLPEYNRYIEVKGYFSDIDKEKLRNVVNKHNIDLLLIRNLDEIEIDIRDIIAAVSPHSYKV